MNNKNRMGLWSFVDFNVLYGILTTFVFDSLFRIIPNTSYAASKWILCITVFVFVTVGIFITARRRRNSLSIAVNVLAPFTVYYSIVYFKDLKSVFIVLIVVASALSAGYIYIVFSAKKPSHHDRKRVFVYRLKRSLLGSRTIFVLSLSTVFIVLIMRVFITDSIYTAPKVTPPSDTNQRDVLLEENADTLLNLRDDVWVDLSADEKLRTLKTVANIESKYLGLEHDPVLEVNEEKENEIAHYANSKQKIVFNINYFDRSSVEMVRTICHESYHAYQARMVEVFDALPDPTYRKLLAFRDVEKFKYEFSNYVNAEDEEDFLEYYTQVCESTAREYGYNAAVFYFNWISDHLTEQEK